MHTDLVLHRALADVRGFVALHHRGLTLPVGKAGSLDQAMGNIDAEAVDAAIQPEAQDVLELRAHLGVFPVQVGLPTIEQVQVLVLIARGAGPRPAAKHASWSAPRPSRNM